MSCAEIRLPEGVLINHAALLMLAFCSCKAGPGRSRREATASVVCANINGRPACDTVIGSEGKNTIAWPGQ